MRRYKTLTHTFTKRIEDKANNNNNNNKNNPRGIEIPGWRQVGNSRVSWPGQGLKTWMAVFLEMVTQ